MKTNSIENRMLNVKNYGLCTKEQHNSVDVIRNFDSSGYIQTKNVVAFKGHADLGKRFYLHFRKLSNYMKNPSEMTNAIIVMIGTGIIAPFAIMCSPKKKCHKGQSEKTEREKKFFQALRQPVSAFLAFAFQVPTTVGIARLFDYMAFKKHLELFKDKDLGNFIPIKEYLVREAKKALKENADPELKKEWATELKLAENTAKLKEEFKAQLKNEYKNVGLEISDAELDKLVNNKRRFDNFVAEKVSKEKYAKLLEEKLIELQEKNFEIKDIDLVTPKYQNLAKQEFREEFETLRKNAKLNFFDRFISTMGFSNKKLDELGKAEKQLAKEKGLILMKKDVPDFFKNGTTRLKKFIKDKNAKAQKIYGNKVFWLSLVANLFMIAASCTALNWLHPKFAQFVDNIRGKNKSQKAQSEKKVEVKA